MKRFVVALSLVLASLSAARAESVLRSMVTTDIRGLMPRNSPDDNTGLVLQQIYEGLVAWRADASVPQAWVEKLCTLLPDMVAQARTLNDLPPQF